MPQERAVRLLAGPFGRQLFAPIMRNHATIFMLHRISDTAHGIYGHEVEFIRESLQALRDSGAKFVSLRALINAWQEGVETDPDWVIFTIDDGFADQGELISAAFVPMECPVTVFTITGFLDGKLWPWDDQLAHAFNTATVDQVELQIEGEPLRLNLADSAARRAGLHEIRNLCKSSFGVDPYLMVARVADALGTSVPAVPPEHYRPLTWDQARALERCNVDFAPHSVTHRIFSQLSAQDAREELTNCWARMEAELDHPLRVFAWPTGRAVDFAPRDMKLAQELEYHAAVSTNAGYATRPAQGSLSLYGLPRFSFPHNIATVLRYGSWLERGRQLLPF